MALFHWTNDNFNLFIVFFNNIFSDNLNLRCSYSSVCVIVTFTEWLTFDYLFSFGWCVFDFVEAADEEDELRRSELLWRHEVSTVAVCGLVLQHPHGDQLPHRWRRKALISSHSVINCLKIFIDSTDQLSAGGWVEFLHKVWKCQLVKFRFSATHHWWPLTSTDDLLEQLVVQLHFSFFVTSWLTDRHLDPCWERLD